MVGKGPWVRFATVLLLCGGAVLSMASAQPPAGNKRTLPPSSLPAVLQKPAPENVQDLRDLENHVQKVVQRVMPAVVALLIGNGQGSGVIVSEDGVILTAGHVSSEPNKNAIVVLPNAKKLKGKTLGRYINIDSGMVKIVSNDKAPEKYPYLEIGKSADLKVGQWVIAVGHPGGFRSNRTPVVRVGRILYLDANVIRTDCTLVGGDSGGPLFDMQGRLIGIHSRIGDREITENVHVPIDTFRQTWDRLALGESWGTRIGDSTVLSGGGKIVFEKKDKLTKDDPTDPVQKDSHRKTYTFAVKAGAIYTIDLVGGDKSGKSFDPFLRLESAAGKELDQNDDGAGGHDARIVYRSPRDGECRIIATSFLPSQTGSFHLVVRQAVLHGGEVQVFRAIRLPPPHVAKVLQELGKVRVRPVVNALLVDAKGLPLPGKEIILQWDTGTEVAKANSEGFIRWPLRKDRSRQLSMQLPAGVRVALTLTDQVGNDLSSFFEKAFENVDVEEIKSAGGAIVRTIDGSLSSNDPIDPERKKCHSQVHEFQVKSSKTYTIDLISEDFDAYLRLESADKKTVGENDDGAGFNNARIVFTPDRAGTYRIVVTSCDPGQTGNYRLTIRETEAKPSQAKN